LTVPEKLVALAEVELEPVPAERCQLARPRNVNDPTSNREMIVSVLFLCAMRGNFPVTTSTLVKVTTGGRAGVTTGSKVPELSC
jgi:hypothetical protein